MCCFSAKHAAIRRNIKDCVAWNRDNVSEWSEMSTHRLLFQWPSTIKNPTKHVGQVQSKHHYHLIECNLFSPWYSWKIAHLALNNNHSLKLHNTVNTNSYQGNDPHSTSNSSNTEECRSWLVSCYIVAISFVAGGNRRNHRPAASHWQTLSHNVVSSTPRHKLESHNHSGDRYWLHR